MSSPVVPHLRCIWLIAASKMAGVVNATAGGGSFLSFPAILNMGVPQVQANAGCVIAGHFFWRERYA